MGVSGRMTVVDLKQTAMPNAFGIAADNAGRPRGPVEQPSQAMRR
jgi:hypothetical protein